MLSYLIEVRYQISGVDRVIRIAVSDPISQDPFARAIEIVMNKHFSRGESVVGAQALFVEAR